jgi:ATP-dependent 26S proteasome regulatory subunit
MAFTDEPNLVPGGDATGPLSTAFSNLACVIIVAATNRRDSAALRSCGGFGMNSHVPLPDKDGRIEILCLDLRNAKFKSETVARTTNGGLSAAAPPPYCQWQAGV